MSSKPSILIMISNEKERKILEMAFNQRGFEVIIESANHNAYIKTLQFLPDIIFIQFDNKNGIEQERFTKAILANKKGSKIFIIGYISKYSNFNNETLKGLGIKTIFVKPLKFSSLLKKMTNILIANGKTLDSTEKVTDKIADIELLLNSNTNPIDKIEIMANYVDKLYAFPFAVAQIIKITKDQNSSAKDLAKIIETDSVITTNMLKLSNTVFYATKTGRVSSIKNAIIRIGFNETKKLASSMAIMDLFNNDDKTMGYSGMEYWLFTISVSVISEVFAKNMDIDETNIYITSLLHGFGIISYNQYFPDIFSIILNENIEKYYYYPKTEKEILGTNNFNLAAELFDRWQLPKSVGKALREIKLFNEFPETLNSNHENIAYLISIARIITKFLFIGKDCDSFVQILDKKVFDFIKFKVGITDGFINKIHKNIFDLIEVFGLDKDLLHRIPDVPTKNRIGIYNIDNIMFIGIDKFLLINGYNVDVVNNIDNKKDFIDEVSVIVVSKESDNAKVSALINNLIEKFSSSHKNKIILIADKKTDAYKHQKESGVITFDHNFDIRVFEDTIDKIIGNANDTILVPHEKPNFDKEAIFDKIRDKMGIKKPDISNSTTTVTS